MESLTLMLWIFVVPLHAYVLQPSAHVVALEDSGSEETSWYEGGKEPLTPVEDQDSHGEGGSEPDEGLRAEAGEVEREERDEDGKNQAHDEEGKRHEEGHREGKIDEHRNLDEEMEMEEHQNRSEEKEMEEQGNLNEEKEIEELGNLGAEKEIEEQRNVDEEKEVTQRVKDVEKEGELRADLVEKGAQYPVEDEIFGEVNKNLKEYRFSNGMDVMQGTSSPSINTDTPHFNPNPGFSIETEIPYLSPNIGLSVMTDIPHLSSSPGLPIETDTSHLSPNLDLSKETDIPHLRSNLGLSIATDIPQLTPIPGLSIVTGTSNLSPNNGHTVETDIHHLGPDPGISIETDISRLNHTPSPNLYVDQNSSVSHHEQHYLQIFLPTADSSVTPTVSLGPVTAGESEEAILTPVKPNSMIFQLRNLTDGSQPHLREEEGLVPKAIEVKLDSFRDLTNMNSVTQEQKWSEKKRSKLNRLMLKPKKKKTHPAKKTETARSKQQNSIKVEEKSKSLKKEKKKNKKKKQKENTKDEKETPSFPYFNDNYCPKDCACYGRVVQCSDKSLDKIPYGIPYDARYVLLMNNQISGIQLDLLREYISLEFLVLSNNLLTDGSIEGAFEGMRQLKRLYLDRNQLDSIPTDLPPSLEELRLDGNNVSVMSEVAWAHSPSLQILSINNNTLGAESVPKGVFNPLTRVRTLSLNYNYLTAVPVNLPTNIKELYLRGNHIDVVPRDAFAEGSDLLVLDLSNNRLTNKGLTKDSLRPLVHLENLNLEGNLIRNIPKHFPPTLRTLNLEGNAITSISKAAFLGLPHLEHLGLSHNQITRVAPGTFWELPALHQLELGHNVLRQVPRRLPPSLHSVSLVHNKIHSIPRDSFCTKGKDSPLSNLVRVYLEHNLINLADLDTQAFNCLRGYQVIHFY